MSHHSATSLLLLLSASCASVGCFDFDRIHDECLDDPSVGCDDLGGRPDGAGGGTQDGSGGSGGGPIFEPSTGGAHSGGSESGGSQNGEGILVINEILPSSTRQFIELYNTGTGPFSLNGLSLSVEVGEPDPSRKFSLGTGSIAPGEFLVVQQSLDDCIDASTTCLKGLGQGRTPLFFTEESARSTIYVLDASNRILIEHPLPSGRPLLSMSWARYVVDGIVLWRTGVPTPGAANGD